MLMNAMQKGNTKNVKWTNAYDEKSEEFLTETMGKEEY